MLARQVYTLGYLAECFGLSVHNGGALADDALRLVEVHGFASLQDAGVGQLSFLSSQHYKKHLAVTRASAVILRGADASACPVPCLVTENPYLAYAKISALFARNVWGEPDIHAQACVSPDAKLSSTAVVGPFAVIEAGACVGEGSVIAAGCFVGRDAVIGSRCVLHPKVTVYHDVTIGDDVVLHAGVVIGSDGFGFAKSAEGWCKIHQLGSVLIGNGVEIGANTCIDRGAIDDTVIEDGVIIDNLVQVAHNVRIGKNTAIAACTGIAGSAVIGANCTIAGAVGIVGHITIADGVHVTAKSLVTGSITEAGSYSSGTALQPTASWRKNAVRFLQLDRLVGRVKALESGRSQG